MNKCVSAELVLQTLDGATTTTYVHTYVPTPATNFQCTVRQLLVQGYVFCSVCHQSQFSVHVLFIVFQALSPVLVLISARVANGVKGTHTHG